MRMGLVGYAWAIATVGVPLSSSNTAAIIDTFFMSFPLISNIRT
jgi:hypothetical protein